MTVKRAGYKIASLYANAHKHTYSCINTHLGHKCNGTETAKAFA